MKMSSLMELFFERNDAPRWSRANSPGRRPRPARSFQPLQVEVLELRSTPSAVHTLGLDGFLTVHSATTVGHHHAHTHAHSFLGATTIEDGQGDTSLQGGCCAEIDPALPSGVSDKSANPMIEARQGIIVDKFGNVTGYGTLDGKKLEPIGGTDPVLWQKVQSEGGCASVVIQLPGGGFGYYHLANLDQGNPKAVQKAIADLNKFLDAIKPLLGGQPPSCIRVIPGSEGGGPNSPAGMTCAALTGALTAHGISVPPGCSTPAPKFPPLPGGKPGTGVPYPTWLDPNGEIHFIGPLPAQAKPPGKSVL